MHERVSPENLLPLSVAPPAPQVELPPLAQAPIVEQNELPTLEVVSQVGESTELPTLAVISLAEPAVVKPLSNLGSEASDVSLIAPKPVVVPKTVKPSALKPAVKITRRATTRARVNLAVEQTVPKIVPVVTEKLKSIQLRERGIKLGQTALKSVNDQLSHQVKSHKQRKLLFKPVDGTSWAFDMSGSKTAAQPSKNSPKLNKIKTIGLGLSVANLKDTALGFATDKKNALDEALYARKSYLGGAIGVVALAGVAVWLNQKGFDLTPDAPQLIEAADAANLTDPSAPIVDTPEPVKNPVKPSETIAAFDQTPATSGQPASSFEKVFVVDGGEGIVENIMDAMAENGVEVSATEAHDIYHDLDAKLDGQLITGDTYRMANGDLGISQAGQFAWQQEMQNALEEIAKEKKKQR